MGSMSGFGCFEDAIQLMKDPRFRSDILLTRRIGLDELIDSGLRALIDRGTERVKILVSPRT
ncbi:MAG: hypothetical protein ACRD2B_16180 [Terriglobia bacterium]